jgi:hypothetical protein
MEMKVKACRTKGKKSHKRPTLQQERRSKFEERKERKDTRMEQEMRARVDPLLAIREYILKPSSRLQNNINL